MSVVEQAASRAVRDVAYLAVGLVTGAIAAVVWAVGFGLSLGLAVLIVGLPVIVATGFAFKAVTDLDRRNAALVLGRPLQGTYRPRASGVRGQVRATLGDPQTWRDFAWLILHSVIGVVFGCLALGAVAGTLGLLVLPAWSWSLPDGADLGIWRVDTLLESFAGPLLAVPAAVLTVGLARVLALGQVSLATLLLGPPGSPVSSRRDADPSLRPRREPRNISAGVAVHAEVAAGTALVFGLLWALTGFGTFWPAWIWLALAIALAVHVIVARALAAPQRRLGVAIDVCVTIGAVCVIVWALAGFGYFWPIWPIFGMAVGVGLRALVEYRHELPWVREQRLVRRVDELTRTRAGALDVQAEELRRIERDLHDGAQARLVSLSMLVGRAEAQLDDRPEVAELVRAARDEASAAIRELRDLARGIAPPVLADRGLVAAVESLAVRSPMPVEVEAPQLGRLAPVVETAAYFVVAEALTNTAKHGGGAPATVTLARPADTLRVEVADTGPGGADATAGTGLAGLRSRVAALDGTLDVSSSAAGTTIVAELPCGS